MNKYFKLLFSALISILGLYLAFSGQDITELWHQILQVDMQPFWIAVGLLIFSCVVRAYRWQLLLDPVEHIPLHNLFAATMIGYFGNGVLVFRLGELLKAYSAAQDRVISVSQTFGTVILERILDLLMVVLIFSVLIPWFPFEQDWLRHAMQVFSLTVFLMILFIGLAYKFEWLDVFEDKMFFQHGLGEKFLAIGQKVFDGVTIIRKTRHGFSIALSSILLWGIYYSTTILILAACGIDLGWIGAGILFMIGSVAIGIPALPGSAGTYDAGVKYGLVIIFGISGNEALAYALVSHAVSYFPLVIIGAGYFAAGSVKLTDLREKPITP